jgi:hypothetical protein
VNPDSGVSVLGAPIPDFDRVLEIAVHATDQTGLGYVGADVVVDARLGPVILEMNARPGLAIQLANRAGLLHRLDAVDALERARPLRERVSSAARSPSAAREGGGLVLAEPSRRRCRRRARAGARAAAPDAGAEMGPPRPPAHRRGSTTSPTTRASRRPPHGRVTIRVEPRAGLV